VPIGFYPALKTGNYGGWSANTPARLCNQGRAPVEGVAQLQTRQKRNTPVPFKEPVILSAKTWKLLKKLTPQ